MTMPVLFSRRRSTACSIRVVEPQEQSRNRRLSAAGATKQSQHAPGPQFEIDVLEDRVTFVVSEVYLFK